MRATNILIRPHAFAVAALALSLGAVPALAQTQEIEDRGTYYEDDAWYDITEWLDNNDYNPTDEVAERWDDDVYGNDYDASDYDTQQYGFDDDSDDDDWFYDYYDTGYYNAYDRMDQGRTQSDQRQQPGQARHDHIHALARYYDYDADGMYDAYYTVYDWDGDGTADNTMFYSFNTGSSSADQSQRQAKSDRQMGKSSTRNVDVQGEVQNIKRTTVQGDKHLIAQVTNQQGQQRLIDLGPVSSIQNLNIKQGETIKARGPMCHVGDKQIIAARWIEYNGNTRDINRSGQKFTGSIVDTNTATVHGHEHLIAVLDKSGKNWLVDLGPKNRIDASAQNLQKGTNVTIHGVPVRANDRLVIMATQLTANGKTHQINRLENTRQPKSRQGMQRGSGQGSTGNQNPR